MSGCLKINSQSWKLLGSDGLKLFLPRQRLDNSIYFQTDWSFVPPEVDAATVTTDTPKLRLRLIGFVPNLRDWRDLENKYLAFQEQTDSEDSPVALGPDMWIFQPGETEPLRFGHWATDLKFGARHGLKFEFTLEALARSERAAKFKTDCAVKEFFNQPETPEWELPEWINEGDQLSFAGRIEFREIFCSVPINSVQPIELAKQLARRELAMEQFGPVILSDADHPADNYKPTDGISETGRLVVLPMSAG